MKRPTNKPNRTKLRTDIESKSINHKRTLKGLLDCQNAENEDKETNNSWTEISSSSMEGYTWDSPETSTEDQTGSNQRIHLLPNQKDDQEMCRLEPEIIK